MSFSNNVPDVILENPSTAAFMSVLDKLQEYKSEIVSSAIRGNNYAMLNSKKWIVKYLSNYGIEGLPLDLPLAVMQQLLLNVGTLFSTRGSKIGLEFFCSLLSLGEVTVDDSKVYVEPSIIMLDSLLQGYIRDNSTDSPLYIMDDNSLLNPRTSLRVAVKSKFFNDSYPTEERAIKEYILKNIRNWLGFSDITVHAGFLPRKDFYFHRLLNKYFV